MIAYFYFIALHFTAYKYAKTAHKNVQKLNKIC